MEQLVRLGDVCTVVSGSTPKTSVDEYWNGDVKWITPAELDADSYYIHDSVKHITELGRTKTGLSYMPVGTVILSSRAPIGKTAILGCEMCCNQGFKNLICTDRIFNEYLYHFLRAKTNYLNSLGRGATFKELSKGIVENVLIPLPAIEEQHHIADLFASVEELIQTKKQQLDLFDELVKSRFIELFGDQETNPYNLNVGKLSDVAEIYLGLTHTPTYVEQGKPFLSVRDISSGVIDFSNCHYITEEEFCSLPNGARPRIGDMLFCRVGTIGKPVIIPENTPEFGTFVSVGYLRRKANVNNYYLKSWMENDFFMRQVYDNVAGASQINLNTGWLKNFRILIPSMEQQNQFATFVEQTDKSKLAVQQSITELEELKKSLMQKYFG